jgi:hypothetical protein
MENKSLDEIIWVIEAHWFSGTYTGKNEVQRLIETLKKCREQRDHYINLWQDEHSQGTLYSEAHITKKIKNTILNEDGKLANILRGKG